jgi:hypothetical protein
VVLRPPLSGEFAIFGGQKPDSALLCLKTIFGFLREMHKFLAASEIMPSPLAGLALI